jgi:hypothetical protein
VLYPRDQFGDDVSDDNDIPSTNKKKPAGGGDDVSVNTT